MEFPLTPGIGVHNPVHFPALGEKRADAFRLR